MDSVNFTRLTCTPTSTKKKLNYTYTKTLSRNSFSVHPYLEQATNSENSSSILKSIGLTESIWELYQVNALYDYSYQRIKLYEYQKLLAQNVKQAILESDAHEYNCVEIVVKVEKYSETAFTEKDNPGVKFTIIASDISDGITNEYTEIFCGFLISVERKEGFREEEKLRVGATILPLVLVRYENKIFLQSFMDFLEENFSCFVSPLNFSSMDLKWILTLFTSPDLEATPRSTVLQYETPIEELKSIDYAIDSESIRKVWDKILGNVEIVTQDHVNEFFSDIERHFYDIFHIDLSKLELVTVRTPLGLIERNGSVYNFQAYDSNKLYFIMRHLTHVAQEILD